MIPGNAAGRLVQVGSPQGTVSYQHNGVGRLTAICRLDASQQPLAEYGYVLDATGNRMWLDVTVGGSRHNVGIPIA